MDPLSDVLSLLKLRSYISGAVSAAGDWCFDFPPHEGIKFRAVLSGSCWVQVDGMKEPFLAQAGDCFLLPLGRAVRVGTRFDIPPLDIKTMIAQNTPGDLMVVNGGGEFYSIGGYCLLEGDHAGILLGMLPPVLQIQGEQGKSVLHWCVEHMREEMREPQPGGFLIAQQLAQMLLVQALRAHLLESGAGVGWLFALSDKQLSASITAMHAEPARPWTVEQLAHAAGMSRTAFALRFKDRVGQTPMEYLTRWRMLLADDRLRHSREPVSAVALSLGYTSESAFNTAFKRVMGAAPRRHTRRAA
ncbi:AraC family transcriptional regulator [Acidocella sp.]|jgi:AraC-like DNA-binding protein|uniref:AraC family transcriptional regulator n=1 Tax=Acidocella sp. TaxID=50710 RepID=UPI002F40B10D